MKALLVTTFAALGCVALLAAAPLAHAGGESQPGNPNMGAQKEVKRGAPLGKSETVKLSKLMAEAKKFEGKTVKTEGQVQRVCKKKGCWMELTEPGQKRGVRVTFKDYGFFVPKDGAGTTALCEGTVEVKTLPKEVADHYESEGAKVSRNTDGTANEVRFVATGVKLTKK